MSTNTPPMTTIKTNATPLSMLMMLMPAQELPLTSFGVDIHIIITNTIHSVSINYYCYLLYLSMHSRYHSLGIASAKDATRRKRKRRGAMAGLRSPSYRGIGKVFFFLFIYFYFIGLVLVLVCFVMLCFVMLCFVMCMCMLCFVMCCCLCFVFIYLLLLYWRM